MTRSTPCSTTPHRIRKAPASVHEMGIAMTVVAEVERVLDTFGPEARAVSVTLQVGGLRAVVPEALEFCYMAASQGSRAEGARLIIEEVPVLVSCPACTREWTVAQLELFCPTCEGPVQVLSGKELLLRTIEVDQPDGPATTDEGGVTP